MITIKDFKKGDKAYILSDQYSRRVSITETTVTTVGNKYVTVGGGYTSRKFRNWDSNMLLEQVDCGTSDLLFKTRQDAEDYIEAENLWLELKSSFSSYSRKYSLDQLKRVKEILEEQ